MRQPPAARMITSSVPTSELAESDNPVRRTPRLRLERASGGELGRQSIRPLRAASR
jgi:hypothetical protein